MSKLLFLLIGLPGVGFFTFTLANAAAEGSLPSPVTLIIPAIVIIVLVLLNGFFVAAEIAIVGVRPSQMEQLSEEGNQLAESVSEVLSTQQDQDRYIATAQLGITIASLGLAYYGEPQIGHFVEPYLAAWLPMEEVPEALVSSMGYIIALSLLTYLHIVIGEMVPKSLALTDSARVSMELVRPMRFFAWLMGVPVRFLNGIGRLLLRLFRIPPVEGHERVLSPEELELLVTESAEEGLLIEEEEEMIRNIFDFGDRIVGHVMTPRRKVQAIPVEMPYEEMLQLVADSRHSRFPVYEENLDHIIGMVHIKDLARHSLKPDSRFDIRLMLRAIPVVSEEQRVERLLANFKRERQHLAVVLDEFGGMAGIVTLEDLVEEVVGEVRDEFDQEKEPFIQVAPGIVEMSGEFLVDDLLEDVVYLGEEVLPDVSTVGGLIVSKLGRPPAVGDQVTYNEDRVRFKVLAVDHRAVVRVRLEYPAPEEGETPASTVSSPTENAAENKNPGVLNQPGERREKWNSS